jgi:hypothetical protein
LHGWEASKPDWSKWRPSDPTSAHWYEAEQFERLVAAYTSATTPIRAATSGQCAS